MLTAQNETLISNTIARYSKALGTRLSTVMRVIAGQFGSRPLRSLPGMDTRPTSDRLRETLFNVVTAGNPQTLVGSTWIDVFAGTGAVGVEALSRGARMVYFIESATKAAELIRANLKSLGITEGFEVLQRDATSALRRLDSSAVCADYVFLDPPYRSHAAYAETLELLSRSKLLHSDSVVVAEHDKRFDSGERVGTLMRWRVLKQGDAVLSFYRSTKF